MAFSNMPHCILMFMVSFFILTLFVAALDVSDSVAEAPGPGSGGDGFFPLAKKHVVIHNVISNKQTLNVHCNSSDDDLGLIHIRWNRYWGFRFRVNIWETTSDCIWEVGRDAKDHAMCRITEDSDPYCFP
uniref:S-protein homolog n=2 Tax=Brassica oleracea TaxID=3712 RepID=A0A0D3CYU9_BRAOL